jgi:hypothetical protein
MRFSYSSSIRNVKFLAVLLVSSLILLGCDSTGLQSEQDNSQVLQEVEQFRSTYSAGLNHIGVHLDSTGASLGNKDAVKTGLQSFTAKRFGAESQAHVQATNAFVSSRASEPEPLTSEAKSSSLEDLPANVRNVVRNTEETLRASARFKDFKENLRQTRKKVLNEDWSAAEKRQALTYIAVVEESLAFLKRNRHLVADGDTEANGGLVVTSEEEPSWWECISGAAGDAGELAIAGAGVGCAIGAGTTGGPGCGPAAAIGGSAGALSGAASGAADHCF